MIVELSDRSLKGRLFYILQTVMFGFMPNIRMKQEKKL